jgi:hypothetical protein
MAARLKPFHADEVRAKIQTSQLVNRLQSHAFGKIDLEPERVQSIRILLNKTLPDLKAIEHSGQIDGTVVVRFNPT